jgi:hypothetical protein
MQKWAIAAARKVHELKCWPDEYQAVLDGKKLYEIRKGDRDFQVKDALHLREWDPETEEYSGRSTHVVVTHITQLNQWIGSAGPWVVMGIM